MAVVVAVSVAVEVLVAVVVAVAVVVLAVAVTLVVVQAVMAVEVVLVVEVVAPVVLLVVLVQIPHLFLCQVLSLAPALFWEQASSSPMLEAVALAAGPRLRQFLPKGCSSTPQTDLLVEAAALGVVDHRPRMTLRVKTAVRERQWANHAHHLH